MVCCSLVHAGEELLELRGGLEAYAERGSTMGIPLLHPWANRLAGPVAASPLLHTDANGMPIHGVLPAALPFAIEHETASSLDAVFATDDHPDVLEVFPYPHRLRVQASLTDDALEIRTTLLALGRRPVPVAFGYHPYLRLPAESRPAVEIEVPAPTRLVLDERQIPTGQRIRAAISPGPLGERVFDDAFADVGDGTAFVVRGSGRTISVTFLEGYRFAPGLLPGRERVHRLRADDRADQRPHLRRRAHPPPARRRLQRRVPDQRRRDAVTDRGHGRRRTRPPRTSGRAGWCRAERRSAPRLGWRTSTGRATRRPPGRPRRRRRAPASRGRRTP